MKKIITLLITLIALKYSIAQQAQVKMGKTLVKIDGQKINSYKTRDVRTNQTFTTTNYFNITATSLVISSVVLDGKVPMQLYVTKTNEVTTLTATVEEDQNERYMQGIMYKVIITCPDAAECATQTVTTNGEAKKLVTKETEIILYFENKKFAEAFAKAFKTP